MPDTYDICLGAIEKGSVVIISALGCTNHKAGFLNGFEEMKKRIEPPIIIVVGNMISGMTGTFINFRYDDSFANPYEQLKLEGFSSVFTIAKEAK